MSEYSSTGSSRRSSMSDEDFQDIYEQISQIVICVQNTRQAMFELVEIPHLCFDLQRCFFSIDMTSIKKAHQYMKQSISNSYYQQIKKQLQEHLTILLQAQQLFVSLVKDYEMILEQIPELQPSIQALRTFFSNPNSSKLQQLNTLHTCTTEDYLSNYQQESVYSPM